MASALYLLGVTVLLLVALGLTIPVLIDIFREGLQRQGALDKTDTERDAVDPATQSHPADDASTETGVCSNCGVQNDPKFTYCQQCAKRL